MFLPDFQAFAPTSLDEALALLNKHGAEGAMPLAGGTDLIVRMKEGALRPRVLILLDRISRLGIIEATGGRIRIGALATFDQLMHSDILHTSAPILIEAAGNVGSPQIRNRGTIGGNIANASPCADTIPALYVLEADVILQSVSGERRLPIAGCFKGPKESMLCSNEVLTYIEFPIPKQPENFFYLTSGQRRALSINKLSVAGQISFAEEETVMDARIAYGAVAPTVLRGVSVEAFLMGKKLTPDILEISSELAQGEIRPIDDIRSTAEWRRHVTGVLLKRGLASIAAKNKKSESITEPDNKQ
jgi:CO/xanthine dehydrogenase FAD-binding subunit